VTVNYDPALEPVNTESLQRPGVLQYTAGRLEAGAQTSLQLQFKCVQPDPVATVSVTAVADNMQREARASWDVEVLGPISSPNDGGVAPVASNIQATFNTSAVQEGKNTTIFVTLTNTGPAPETNVRFRVGVPPQFNVDFEQTASANRTNNLTFNTDTQYFLTFAPVDLRPNEPLTILLRVTAAQAGDARLRVEYQSQSMPSVQFREEVITIAPR
jgi:hypothetical protein